MAVISLLNLPIIAPADTGTTQAPDDTTPPRNPCRAVAFWTFPIALRPAPKNRLIPVNEIRIEKHIYHRCTITYENSGFRFTNILLRYIYTNIQLLPYSRLFHWPTFYKIIKKFNRGFIKLNKQWFIYKMATNLFFWHTL